MKLAKEYLDEFGIKPSIQRIAVMKYLMQNHIHPTVEDIYNSLHETIPTLSKTTIYNTLSLFVEAGVISSINIDEKNLRYDIVKSPHAHFKCKKCHTIIDLPVPHVCHEVFAIADKYKDLEIHEAEISLWGYCKDCK